MCLLVALACVSASAATYVVPSDEALIGRTDAIVVARALHSHAEESPERGIEMVTEFAVEEVIKGATSLADGLRVRSPGGAIDSKVKLVPGAPRFVDGDRVLLFVRNVGAGDFATTDLALGLFAFATDDRGRRILVRSEVDGWNPDGSIHAEQARDADRFIAFVRSVVNRRTASNDYTIAANPLVTEHHRMKTSMSVPTATQYTLASTAGVENSRGSRWKTFPAAVNWNRGSAEVNTTNGGSDLINTAFAAWNGEPSSNVNYVLATANPNANGINDPTDSINNIVFEKDLTPYGVAAYSCSAGGVLGMGGISLAVTDPTNVDNGELFFRATESDVSMNSGTGPCLPGGTGQLSVGNYLSAMTHEFGHTLGLRHSDLSRDNSQPCTNLANYDCSNAALMNHILISGLNGVLTAWDQRAIEALYPAPAAPGNVAATADGATSVSLTWAVVPGTMSYTIYRSADNSTYSNIGTSPTNNFTDSTAMANTAYLYKVTATMWGVQSPSSNRDLATTVIFTDPLLVAQATPVKAVHITELRTAVDAVRKLANGGVANNFNYTDAAITPQLSVIRAIDITELRSALDAARLALALPSVAYTAGTTIQAVQFTELRSGVQ